MIQAIEFIDTFFSNNISEIRHSTRHIQKSYDEIVSFTSEVFRLHWDRATPAVPKESTNDCDHQKIAGFHLLSCLCNILVGFSGI